MYLQLCSNETLNNSSRSTKTIIKILQVVPEKWIERMLEVSQSKKYNEIEEFVEEFMLEAYASSQVMEQLNTLIISSDDFTDKQKAFIAESLGVRKSYSLQLIFFLFS